MTRAFVLILDWVGIGSSADATRYGDDGADTIGHIAQACVQGQADGPRQRSGSLAIPNLVKLGLGEACRLATGRVPSGLASEATSGQYGCASELSRGKDTPSGHWELAGVPVLFEWAYFPRQVPAFPPPLIDALCQHAGLAGTLGNRHASGTEIIVELGEEHMRSGKPICYTSADSVFQIAAHEQAFGLNRLYEVCCLARRLLDSLNIGRVIARPFIGTDKGDFLRTNNRPRLRGPAAGPNAARPRHRRRP